MKKVWIFSFLFFAYANSFGGVASNFGFGLNYSGTNFKDNDSVGKHSEPCLSGQMGYDYIIGESFSLGIALGLETSGENRNSISRAGKSDANPIPATIRLGYLRLPIYAKYMLNFDKIGIQGVGGFVVSKNVNADFTSPDTSFKKNTLIVNKYDYGLEGGFVFHLFFNKSDSFYLNPLYYYGLTKVMKDEGQSALRNFKIHIGFSKLIL